MESTLSKEGRKEAARREQRTRAAAASGAFESEWESYLFLNLSLRPSVRSWIAAPLFLNVNANRPTLRRSRLLHPAAAAAAAAAAQLRISGMTTNCREGRAEEQGVFTLIEILWC